MLFVAFNIFMGFDMGEIAAIQQPAAVVPSSEDVAGALIGIVNKLSEKDRYLLLSIALLLADPLE